MASFTIITTTLNLLLLLSCTVVIVHSDPIFSEFIRPNFTASYLQFSHSTPSGAFLASRNGTFRAAITNPNPQGTAFYFCVIHAPSNTIVWSANRHSPFSDSAKLRLTVSGLSITDDDAGNNVWSTTPFPFHVPVSLLQLQESGNLVLLDPSNATLWASFDHPTDTIVVGQKLPVGGSIVGAVGEYDFSEGDYRFTVTGADAVLQWNGLTYWRLSMDKKVSKDTNLPVSYMALKSVSGTTNGLCLFAKNGSAVVIQVDLEESDSFRIAKLGSDGSFVVQRFVSTENKWVQEFRGPVDNCGIPLVCGKIGLCRLGKCSCPVGFQAGAHGGVCTPSKPSYSLPSGACDDSQSNSSFISYVDLGTGMDYFANDFREPDKHSVNLSVCQDLCSGNCSCLGIFHGNSSGSCYLLQNRLGSIMASTSSAESDRLGYIKVLVLSSSAKTHGSENNNKVNFPIAGLVLFFLVTIAVMGILCHRRRKKRRRSRNAEVTLGRRRNSFSSDELESISVEGLPVRFNYEEIAAATEKFRTQIGSGGFGIVYKGTLLDKTVVAVKRITSLGGQGKKEFCTEIAIIGNIHHVNLVRLRGFCAHKREMFLVYEYMNRGSLDRTLFGDGLVLEWPERFEIALGTARGLAYLHNECEHKIIHCDVKPENILLNDNLQVKISDFGLSKLLGPEQSRLFTTLRGTRGYLAPEWLTSPAISDKIDVYSYGMVLLEIVRGQRNWRLQIVSESITEIDSSGGNAGSSSTASDLRPVYFPRFALEMHEQRRYLELADPRLEGRVTSEEVEKLVRIGLCCVQAEPLLRPPMAKVVGMLEGALPLGEPRVESLNFLRFTESSSTTEEGYCEMPQLNASSSSSKSYPLKASSYLPSQQGYLSSQQVSRPR